MRLKLIAILSIALVLSACEDPAANKPKATVTEPSGNTTVNTGGAPSEPAKGESLAITPANTTVTFIGSKVTGRHEGGFTMFTGAIDLVNGNPEESSVSADIDVNTLYSDDPKLTEHLKSSDFFDVAKFPKATFRSTKIEPGGKSGDNYVVTGDLELRGQRKTISFPLKIDVTNADVTVKSGFTINRKDFGMVYPGKADDLIRDDVSILIDSKLPRRK
ncbi:MAG TPA: YceI family protein [Pyrinomonadaceae bacterium]|nr:YceI family protein [Pyrinomonadaceae bacterium]